MREISLLPSRRALALLSLAVRRDTSMLHSDLIRGTVWK